MGKKVKKNKNKNVKRARRGRITYKESKKVIKQKEEAKKKKKHSLYVHNFFIVNLVMVRNAVN